MKLLILAITFFCSVSFIGCKSTVTPPPADSTAELLLDWISLQLRLGRNTTGVGHVAYSRHFAYTSIAFYESLVPGYRQNRSLAGQLQALDHLPSPPSKKMCWISAANSSFADMMRFYYNGKSSNLTLIDSLEKTWQQKLGKSGYTSDAISNGSSFGAAIANAVIQWSNSDGSDKANRPYTIPVGEGRWQPTPPANAAPVAPYWGNNRTIARFSIESTMAPAPPAFDTNENSPFYKMVNEVYNVSVHLTEKEKAIATFWNDSPGAQTVTAYGHWASIFKQLATLRHLRIMKAAEAYCKMCITLNDASIVCFKGKYTYNLMRPVTYIRAYLNDPDWLPYIPTPSHPEWPAAHAVLSYSAAVALSYSLGNNISYTDHTYDDLVITPPTFANITEAGKQAGMSRLYGGIHYRPSIEAGLESGKKIADAIHRSIKFER
jgi:hypothetical protein